MMLSFKFSLFAFAFFLTIILLALWVAKTLFIHPPPRVTYKQLSQIRRLLNPPDTSLQDLLHARAVPNQRLVYAFGITNTFVSGDVKVHKAFTTSAKSLIARTGEKDHSWRSMAGITEAAVQQFLPQHSVVEFATLVQCITFAVVLSTLFATDLDVLRYSDVVCATDIINKRWKDSKTKVAAEMQKDDSLQSLVSHLDYWIVDHERYPNPLNYILPAYETMWRVVAVAIAHVYHHHDNTLHDSVIAFGKNPTEEHFVTFEDDHQKPSMQAIILEVLRLHPPTRHIARTTSLPAKGSWLGSTPAIEVADIEGAHMSTEYGENPTMFDPMRFHPSRMQDRPELLSFGHGRLRCVAATWAPMAAAVIAAAIVSTFEETSCTVTTGEQMGGRSGWQGWTVVCNPNDEMEG